MDWGIKPLRQSQFGDLMGGDRHDASYRFLDELEPVDLVIRGSARSFPVARPMLKGQGTDSQGVNLKSNNPKSSVVRFVSVTLNPGEDEGFVTSRADELTDPHELFKELDDLRWGIETFYGFLTTRLE